MNNNQINNSQLNNNLLNNGGINPNQPNNNLNQLNGNLNQLNNNNFNPGSLNQTNLNNQPLVNNQPVNSQTNQSQNNKNNLDLKKVLLLVLLIILVALFIYIIVIKVTDKPSNDNNPVDQVNNKYAIEDFDEYIDILNVLANKQSLTELTNQDKLHLLLNEYLQDESNSQDQIPVSVLKEIHTSSLISELTVDYTDIYEKQDLEGFTYNESSVQYELVGDTYSLKTGSHGLNHISTPVYRELILFNENNGRYTLAYRYVFANTYGDGPNPYYLYYSSQEALQDIDNTGEHSFIKLDETNLSTYLEDNSAINLEAVSKYVADNYSNIHTNLSTYTYTFEELDNHLVLTDFKVTPKAG